MQNCKTEMVNVRMPVPVKDKANAVAQRNGISLSDVMRMALIAGLQEIDSGVFRLSSNEAGGGR